MKPCIISEECLSHGYPRRLINGKYVYLSRYILEQKLGRPINKGYEACHSCNNTKCIEEDHIYEGTHLDNMIDLKKAGNTLFFGNANKEKTHCKYGHEFNEENTIIRRNGARRCITCSREQSKIYNEKRKKFWSKDAVVI